MSNPPFSPEGLQRLHDTMARYVESGDPPGIVTVVARNGEAHVDAVGTQELGGGRPMRRDTIFRIASITKPIVGAAAMSLVEDGSIALDEPIDRLIPELANRRVLKRLDGPLDDSVAARRPILVSDLLTLEMGMGAIMEPGEYPIMTAAMEAGVFVPFRMPAAPSAEAWLAKLAALPLMNHPGEVWRYDTGITVLGALIERAAGKPLGDVLAERIFAPLGMRDTGFVVPGDKLDRLPVCYQRNQASGALEVWDPSGPDSFFATLPGFPGAHGGLVSTADDYLAFAQMMVTKGMAGGRQVLSAKSVETMMADHVSAEVKARSPFVPGFWEKRGWGYAGGVVKRHVAGEPRAGFGWEGGYGTCAYWDAENGIIGLLFTQRLMESPEYPAVYRAFWDGLYAALS
jgi:CubicO group peptidase (beta-lactamase class C family)